MFEVSEIPETLTQVRYDTSLHHEYDLPTFVIHVFCCFTSLPSNIVVTTQRCQGEPNFHDLYILYYNLVVSYCIAPNLDTNESNMTTSKEFNAVGRNFIKQDHKQKSDLKPHHVRSSTAVVSSKS